MTEVKENMQNVSPTRGFWYEDLPNGDRVVCFKVRIYGKNGVKKLKLPKGVRSLEVVS